MKKYLQILKKCALFRGIAEADLLRMLGCLGAKVMTFDKKYTILGEGQPARYIGIILSGTAQIIQVDYYGNRSILSNLVAGEVFGEAFACAGVEALPVTVVAESPCRVMLIDSRHVLHTCEKACGFHQNLIFNLMQDLAAKTILFHRRMEILAKRTTREKLLAYLMLQAKNAGSNTFVIPFDRQALADYLEVDRSGLSTEIGKLRQEGVLTSRKNTFTLL